MRLDLGHGLERGNAVELMLDGRAVIGHEGESVAAVLLAEGLLSTRTTPGGAPRGGG